MSFALFNAGRVVEACDSYITAREQYIAKTREDLIQAEMADQSKKNKEVQ